MKKLINVAKKDSTSLIAIAMVIAVLSTLFTACRKETTNYNSESFSYNENSSIKANNSSDKIISISNLLFTVQLDFPNSENKTSFYYLCFFNDGSVYSMDYSIESENGYNYDFIIKLYSADNSCWDYAENINFIGVISEQEKVDIYNSISKIDIESSFYDAKSDDNGMIPDVEETMYYTFYGYVPLENTVSPFRIQSKGKQQGILFETDDAQAMTALEIITNSEIFVEWANTFHNS